MHSLEDATEPGAETFVLVHGFTQNAACMRPFARALAAAVTERGPAPDVRMIDAPGHGSSGHDAADLVDAASLIVGAGGAGHYVGYSMGGRMLLHAALLFPECVRSLTLIGATPGIEGAADRAARLVADDRLARRLEREGLQAFLDYWLSLGLFASLSDEAAGRTERLTNRVDGLAASLRNCGAGNQFPLWGHLGRIEVPVLVVAGTEDDKFSEIGRRMVDALPNARFAPVAGGHAVHSEDPASVATHIAAFTAGTQPST